MSPPYGTVLEEVRRKLGVTRRAVGYRRARLQAEVSMPNDIALYVLAQQLGLPVHRWVKDAETLQRVAYFAGQLERAGGGSDRPESARVARAARRAPARPELRLDGIQVPETGLTTRHTREAVRMATKVYPLLYVFENSAPEFIDGHLTAAYGEGWWDDPNLELVSKPVRDTVAIARKAQAANRYHSAPRARPIYYTTLANLSLIVNSADGWKVFKPPRFPRHTWFPELIEGAEVSRNIVAHMNPLQPRDVRALEMSVGNWFKQIAADPPAAVP